MQQMCPAMPFNCFSVLGSLIHRWKCPVNLFINWLCRQNDGLTIYRYTIYWSSRLITSIASCFQEHYPVHVRSTIHCRKTLPLNQTADRSCSSLIWQFCTDKQLIKTSRLIHILISLPLLIFSCVVSVHFDPKRAGVCAYGWQTFLRQLIHLGEHLSWQKIKTKQDCYFANKFHPVWKHINLLATYNKIYTLNWTISIVILHSQNAFDKATAIPDEIMAEM